MNIYGQRTIRAEKWEADTTDLHRNDIDKSLAREAVAGGLGEAVLFDFMPSFNNASCLLK